MQYLLKVDMKRSLLSKDLAKACEFIVERPVAMGSGVVAKESPQAPKPVTFNINPDSIQNVKEVTIQEFHKVFPSTLTKTA